MDFCYLDHWQVPSTDKLLPSNILENQELLKKLLILLLENFILILPCNYIYHQCPPSPHIHTLSCKILIYIHTAKYKKEL